mmetsp:Transcript_102456/g.319212  ORF Transcript_102456/g.319212 Transcript_102456/m.319212 type:complete len:200 (-) Transcript_102456:22-621(-)
MGDRGESDLQLLQSSFHVPAPPADGCFNGRSKYDPPSSSSCSERMEKERSDGSSVFARLDNLLQPGTDPPKDESDGSSDESRSCASGRGSRMSPEKKTSRRAPKKKRERFTRFLNWAEGQLVEHSTMRVDEITLPAFIEADARAKEKALARLENFVQRRDSAPQVGTAPPQPKQVAKHASASASSSAAPRLPGKTRMSL